MRGLKTGLLLAGGTLAVGVALAAQQTPQGGGVYTAEQATIGQTAYATACAGCHRADLSGQFEAPRSPGRTS